ncbi:MAG: hypothetical protein VX589_09000 [Myxococcota bacterium]|nr:hypothetical protein [Myxococcota bacterium]
MQSQLHMLRALSLSWLGLWVYGYQPCLAQSAEDQIQDATLARVDGGQKKDPWAVSALSLTNTVSTLSFDRNAEPFYNPTDVITLSGQLRYTLTQDFCLGVGAGLSRELTTPDARTHVDDVWFTDTTITACLLRRQISMVGLTLAIDTAAHLPTSPLSKAASLRMGGEVRIAIQKRLNVPWKPSLSYRFSGRANAHEFTTRQQDAPSIAACEGLTCAELSHTGVRNAWAQQSHGLVIGSRPTSWLSISASGAVLMSHLYDLTPVDGPVRQADSDVETRYAMSYSIAASVQIQPGLSSRLSLNTFNPQQSPDSSYYTPFFNRFSQVSLGLTMNPSTWFQ